jgi:hypothetical protein
MSRRMALLRIYVSEELSASTIRVTRICELETTKRRFLQEPHGVISQRSTFLIVTAVKISNLTTLLLICLTCLLAAAPLVRV